MGGQRLADAVATLLRAADPRHQRLAFTVRVLSPRIEIQISSRDDLMMNVTTRVYDVRDLITGSSATPPSGGIVDRLKRNIAPETWKDRGGRTGAIRELSGQLIITQTHDNQMLVEYELAWLRWRNKMLATAQHAAWIVAPTFFAAISLESILMLRRRRIARRIGLCRNCGYDLRASTERCPECGRPIDAAHRPNVADPVITS